MRATAYTEFAERTKLYNMIEITEVKTNRDIKDFIELPLKMYKSCPYFVPMLYGDEKKLIRAGGRNDVADSVFFLAKRDGKVVGRIQGILHKQANELKCEKRVRFTRFDSINDKEVSEALFSALENWARERGMTHIHGPLGYSDLEREGLLIEGFNENSTYEEQYNYDYYGELIENSGYSKEVDWLEFELRAPEKKREILERIAKRALELNKLHIVDTKSIGKKRFIEKYGDSIFDCIDECYSKLYGTMPITADERKQLIKDFVLVLNFDYCVFICDSQDKIASFGLSFPAFGDALKKSGGKLGPVSIIKLLKAVKKPKSIDLGLVAVLPKYQNTGVNAVIVNEVIDMLISGKIEKCETNLNLETNVQVMSQWKYFNARQHKRRRAYVKEI